MSKLILNQATSVLVSEQSVKSKVLVHVNIALPHTMLSFTTVLLSWRTNRSMALERQAGY